MKIRKAVSMILMGFSFFILTLFFATVVNPIEVKANGYLTDGEVVSTVFVERNVIPREYFTELGEQTKMISETEGYVVYTYGLDYTSSGIIVNYASEVMFFEIVMQSKLLGNTNVECGQNGGNIFVVITSKSTYISSTKEMVMFTSNLSNSEFILEYGNYTEAIWKTENLSNRLYMSDFQFDITLVNVNALNTGDEGYDINQDKGNFFTIIYRDVKGDNETVPDEDAETNFFASAVMKFAPSPIAALVSAYDLMFTTTNYILDSIAEEQPYIPYETLEEKIVELPQNSSDYGSDKEDKNFYRYVETPQMTNSTNTISNVVSYNIDGTIDETSEDSSYAKVSFTANSKGGIDINPNLMNVIVGVSFNIGRKVGLEYIQLSTISEKLYIDNNKYVGLLEKGLYSSNILNSENDVHVYKVIPDFSSKIAFDSLEDDVIINLFDKNGNEIDLYYDSTGYHYSSVDMIKGETYFVSIQSSEIEAPNTLTLRYYRVMPFTGYADFPSTVVGYDNQTTIYEYESTSSGMITISIGSIINAGITTRIYDSNWNLITTKNETYFTYYLVGGRKYYFLYEGYNLDPEEEMFMYNISIYKSSSC